MTNDEGKFADTLARVTSFVQATRIVSDGIIVKLSEILYISSECFEVDKPLYAYGVDSLVSLELSGWIREEMDATITIIHVLESSTLEELTRDVVRRSGYMPIRVKEQEEAKEGQKAAG